MITILSPAKTLDFEKKYNFSDFTYPDFKDDSSLLIQKLQKMTTSDISSIMKLSTSLSKKNFERYKNWSSNVNLSNAKQAILCFKGGVYLGLDVGSFSKDDLNYSQKNLRILSGLYGVLKPFDLIQPHRLEMGTKLINPRGKNLYEFWNNKITESLNSCLNNIGAKYLLNLASKEYFSSIKTKQISQAIIDVKFLDNKNGLYKTISFYAKKARGSMASFVIKNKIRTIDQLKEFSGLGYAFDIHKSNKNCLVFIR